MPQARRFPELGVTPDAPLAQLEQIDHLARTVTTPSPADATLIGKVSNGDKPNG